jgi:hypothetical protein
VMEGHHDEADMGEMIDAAAAPPPGLDAWNPILKVVPPGRQIRPRRRVTRQFQAPVARLAIPATCESELSPVTEIILAAISSAIGRNTADSDDFSP